MLFEGGYELVVNVTKKKMKRITDRPGEERKWDHIKDQFIHKRQRAWKTKTQWRM